MFYCICINNNYSYELYEILTLYYPGEKLSLCEYEDMVPENSMLIKSILNTGYSTVSADISLFKVVNGEHMLLGNESAVHAAGSNIKKSGKHVVKLSLFKLLGRLTGISIPWGILVGIRPSKIVNALKSENMDDVRIEQILKNEYLIREDKAKLVLKVSENSYSMINHNTKAVSVYIDIPFCPSVCLYCSFASYALSKYSQYLDEYIHALDYEMNALGTFIKRHFALDTIYVGGGTPTSLPDEVFFKLMNSITSHFDVASANEFTVEAGRPDTINKYKLNVIKSSGTGRISINPQSMNDDTLKRIGRSHSTGDIVEKFELSRKCGFNNINMDIILGLPGEKIMQVQNTINKITGLSPENITVHTLAVKRASQLKEKLINSDPVPIVDMAEINNIMNYVQDNLTKNGYLPYYMYRQKMTAGNLENVGYCKPGYECLYNIQMIEEKETIIGIGADAVSKFVFHDEDRIERIANNKNIHEYMKSIEINVKNKIEALSLLI